MAVALLTAEQLSELLERAAESGARKALEATSRARGDVEDLDTSAAAELAGVSPDTIRDWIRRRGLPAHRPEGAREHRIRRRDLTEFLAAPAKRRPPSPHGPVDLAARARQMMERSRRR